MVIGCVQHYSTYFIKKLGKSLEPFVPKVKKLQKREKKGKKKGNKWQKKGDFSKINNMYKKKPRYLRALKVA